MTQIQPDDHSRMSWTLLGFEAACTRMLAHQQVDHQSYAATAEALYWACAADEGYTVLLGDRYRAARAADHAGSILPGIRWARNRMTHQRAIVVDEHDGTELGTWVLGQGQLGTRDHLKWALSSTVQPGQHDGGRDVYDARLAGRPVADAVEACRSWLYGMTLNELSKALGATVGDLPGLPTPAE